MNPFKLTTSLFLGVSLLSATASATVSPYNWTGFYAGLNAGGVKHTMNVTDIQASTFYATIQETSDPNFSGGLQVGYRRQLDPVRTSGVYGLEFSTNFSNATFNQEYGSPFALYQLSAENQLKNVYLLQLMGGIAVDRALMFLAAGLSWSTLSDSMTSLDGVPFFTGFNDSKTAFGTAVGGGVEYAVTKAVSARFKLDVIAPNTWLVFADTDDNFQISNNIVQATIGLNYKFG